MAIVDERGRLFGRWNLLDFALLVLLLGLLPLGYGAYVLFRDQPPRLVGVSPAQLTQAPEFTLTIKGENLRPYMRVSLGNNQGREFYFRSTEEAEVPFPAVPAGQYDLVLYDQAQERSRLRNAVTISPSNLPATQIVAVGAFGNLDAAGAAKLTAGTKLGDAAEILAVGKATPDITQVFSGKLVGVPIPNALRLPAVVRFQCYVRAQQGNPFCAVGDVTIAPTVLLTLETALGKTPFQVDRVRSALPLEPVPMSVHLSGPLAVLSRIRPGDADLGGIDNELAALSRVVSVGGPRGSEASGEADVQLIAQLQRVNQTWLYDSTPLRVGAPITLRTAGYEVSGIVIDIGAPKP